METNVYNKEGKKVGSIQLPEAVFGLAPNMALVRQVITADQANARARTAHTKDRGEVSGGGKKPWRQKGTGRARHGSTRSPIWVGGGVTHGPRNDRTYDQKVNKRMRKKALLVVLSGKRHDNEIIVVEDAAVRMEKTKEGTAVFQALTSAGIERIGMAGGTALVAFASHDAKSARALRNLPAVHSCEARNLSARQALETRYVVLPQSSVAVLGDMAVKNNSKSGESAA